MAVKKLFCVIAYDIQKDKSRIKVSKILERYGIRVNLSVFECMVTLKQLELIKNKTQKLIDKHTDSIVFYTLCIQCYSKIIYQPEIKEPIKAVKIL